MNGPEIRRLSSADAILYRDIRLEALKLAPEAFSSTFAKENSEPLTWFASRLGDSVVFGAFAGAELLGIAGFFRQQGQKMAHKGVLVGMYVRPDARRAGLGRRLVEAVIGHACHHVEILQLTVVSGNDAARRLYQRLGFVEYGIERNALKAGADYCDEVLMAKFLFADQAARS